MLFFSFTSSSDFVSGDSQSWKRYKHQPPWRAAIRHNKRHICKHLAGRAGQENNSEGNSWNTSHINRWEDWSLERLRSLEWIPSAIFLHLPRINTLTLHIFSIKILPCRLQTLFSAACYPFIHVQSFISACHSSFWCMLTACSETGNLITPSSPRGS